MTVKVYKEDGKIEEYPNAHITWEWDDETGELGPNSGWRVHAMYKNMVHVNAFIRPGDCTKIEITHEESDKVFEPKPGRTVSKGAIRIAAERTRQIEKEGWTAEHDDQWKGGSLAYAAICYAMPNISRHQLYARDDGIYKEIFDHFWVWDEEWWKPSPENRIRELEKAGALIAAEIDRLLRLGEKKL
jgi:hypothetical protein